MRAPSNDATVLPMKENDNRLSVRLEDDVAPQLYNACKDPTTGRLVRGLVTHVTNASLRKFLKDPKNVKAILPNYAG